MHQTDVILFAPLRIELGCKQVSFWNVCGAVWRSAGHACRHAEDEHSGHYYYYYYYYYLYTTRDPYHSCHWILDQSRALHWSAHLQLKLSLLLYEQGSSWWWGYLEVK